MPTPATILIVDDVPANLGVLFEFLSDSGYRILLAPGGPEALEQVALQPPDLILLDVMMPHMNGFDVCRALKTNPLHRDIPVIFMTALADTTSKIHGFQAGGVDYVTKPIQRDETLARINAHLALRTLQHKLATEIEIKNRFIRIAGHDLRNLVGATLASAHLIIEEDTETRTLTADQTDLANRVLSSGEQMLAVINNFLKLNLTDSNALHPALVPLDLPALARRVAADLRPLARLKQIRLDENFPGQPPPVAADPSLTHQIISNLLSNALKYSPPGTTVTLRSQHLPEKNAVRLEIHDQGPGIPSAERHRLFQDGATFGNRPTGGEQSTGLGLGIVRRLTEAQHGHVNAEFPPTGGSNFSITLPQA